jgi:TrmH family RNA methyltransferase
MNPISSPHNPRLKELRRLQRRRERELSGRFVAEGEDLIAAARQAGREPVEGFRVAGLPLNAEFIEMNETFIEVDREILDGVSTLGSGSRVIGVYEQEWVAAPVGPLCVYLHGVGDPGNVGTVLRAALAFGASCVALGPDCADPHSPKAVRASMGAIFEVSLARAETIGELPGERVGLVASAGEPLASLALAGPLTLLVGAERDGLPAALVDACERVAHIPIASDSLNAAMAATVALYETTSGSTRVLPS